jgi:hypothetical protein
LSLYCPARGIEEKPAAQGEDFSATAGIQGAGAKDSKEGLDGLFTWSLESLCSRLRIQLKFVDSEAAS